MPFVNNFSHGEGTIITAETLDAEIISDTMDIRKLHQMSFFLAFTRDGTATGVVIEFDCSPDGAVWFPVQDQEQTPPDKALVDATWTKTSSATISWMFDLAVSGRIGAPFLRCRLNPLTGGTVDDVMTVQAYGED